MIKLSIFENVLYPLTFESWYYTIYLARSIKITTIAPTNPIVSILDDIFSIIDKIIVLLSSYLIKIDILLAYISIPTPKTNNFALPFITWLSAKTKCFYGKIGYFY